MHSEMISNFLHCVDARAERARHRFTAVPIVPRKPLQRLCQGAALRLGDFSQCLAALPAIYEPPRATLPTEKYPVAQPPNMLGSPEVTWYSSRASSMPNGPAVAEA
jgi:hypothetical protein